MIQTTQQAPTESKSDKLLTVLDAFNVPARIEAVVGYLFASRRKSRKHKHKKRPPGMVSISVPRDYGGTGYDVQDILRNHGIITWGGRTNGKSFVMYVKATQAKWAVSVLRGKGIEVASSVNAKATTVTHTWQGGPQQATTPVAPKPQKPAQESEMAKRIKGFFR